MNQMNAKKENNNKKQRKTSHSGLHRGKPVCCRS